MSLAPTLAGYPRRASPYPLSKTGQNRLAQLHASLQKIINEYLYYKDLSIIEGYRDQKTQNEYKAKGVSNAVFGSSPHNYNPSVAVDIYPYPIPMIVKNGKSAIDDNSKEWDKQAELFLAIAKILNIEVEWGGSWRSLVDKPHFQLGQNNNWRKYIGK